MPICPAGHNSTTADFCDECGAPMHGAAAVPHVPPHAAAEPPTAWYTPQPSPCPECGEPLLDRFCEACGWGPGVSPGPAGGHPAPLDPFGAPQSAPPPPPPPSMFHAPPPMNGAPPPPPPLEPQTAFQVIEQPPAFPTPPSFDHQPSRPMEHTSSFQGASDPFGVPSPTPANPFGAPPPPVQPADPFAGHQPPPVAPADPFGGHAPPPVAPPAPDPFGQPDPFGPPYGQQQQAVAPMGPWQLTADADRAYFERICRSNDLDPNTMQFPAYCPQRRFMLHGPQLLLGRRSASKGINPDIDLSGPPTDAAVSHAHALFVAQPDGRWAVVDVGSSNGTFINESPQALPKNMPVQLNLGDRVHVGLWTTLTVVGGMG